MSAYPSPDASKKAMLARPAWSSLQDAHLDISTGNNIARIYNPEVNVFLATAADDDASWRAAEMLVPDNQEVYVVQAGAPPRFLSLNMVKSAPCVQMVGGETFPDYETSHEIVTLGQTDAAEMLALAELTQPGPFRLSTYKMGEFIGIRINGRLAAMAGERFRFSGLCELSAICTHPEFQGMGLGKSLSAIKSKQIVARGERPFLHAWKTNAHAIKLYEKLGYRIFQEVTASVFVKSA